MTNKKLDEQGYKVIVEDSELEIRLDPREIQGYVLCVKGDDKKFILFPRGTLEELAKADRDRGKNIIEQLAPMGYEQGFFFGGTNLTQDSIIAIATKAYLKEKEDYELHKSHEENNL